MSPFEKGKYQQELSLVIDLDERGVFKAHVENQNGRTVFEFSNEALVAPESSFMFCLMNSTAR